MSKKKVDKKPQMPEGMGKKRGAKNAKNTAIELSGKTGAIIATGGGAILNPENMRNLSKNGRIYFIDRPVEKLVPTSDRPTASTAEAIKKRYEERYPLYKKYADKIIDANCSPAEVCRKIKEDFRK